MTHYEAAKYLGVDVFANKEEITKQFRHKSKLCHPDLFPNDLTKESEFRKLSAAYEILTTQSFILNNNQEEGDDETLDEDLNFIRKNGYDPDRDIFSEELFEIFVNVIKESQKRSVDRPFTKKVKK